MLKQRIITALILIPLVVVLMFTLSTLAFTLLTGGLVIWGAWEWSSLLGVNRFPQSLLYPLFMAALLVVFVFLPVASILHVSVVFWCLAFLLVLCFPKGKSIWGKSRLVRAIMGVFVLIPCWLAVNFVHATENGPAVLLFLFILIWGADSTAYFVGKKWGKHKLIPKVSPGKSWEGLLSALLMAVCIAIAALWSLNISTPIWGWAILLAIVTVLFSILGDLFESMLKRNVNLKDTGQLLPGHGGLLDRIDSLTAAAPAFVVGAMLIGKYFH